MKIFFILILLSIISHPASAEEVMDMPATTDMTVAEIDSTHPILRLSQDKSEMITLSEDAASVVVGNPNHVSVLLDTPNVLVVVPRQAGASHFTVLGKEGNVVMQRHVIVGGPKEKYIRIRRSCDASDRGCEAMSTYFCPGMCHEVSENNTNPSIPR